MSSDGLLLDAAASIGRSIVADAVWHNGSCSWVGAAAGPPGSTAAEYHALGPDLYGGTAGVGLFLAHLADATGDGSFCRTAVGALIHATARARHSPANRRDGFHAGSLGVAWAAARAARLLEEEALHARAVALSAQRGVPSRPDRCPDLVIGMAGSALGLLALADELGDRRLVEASRARRARSSSAARPLLSHGWSWALPGSRHPAHLCGVSHGAPESAGRCSSCSQPPAMIGSRGRAGCVCYERSWLDPATGRWPDLRIGGQRRGALAPIDRGSQVHGATERPASR